MSQAHRIPSLINLAINDGIELTEAQPLLPAAELGATYAKGWKEAEYGCHVSVYEIIPIKTHAEAAAKLDAIAKKDNRRILWGSNGPIFFYAYVDLPAENTSGARYKLAGIVSALAGRE
jgi:hypothetical protein